MAMKLSARCVLVIVLLVCGACASAKPPSAETGEIEGAPWRVDVPAPWNGELVMLAHGFEPEGTPRAAVWPANDATHALLAAGYAVAQSGYRRQGWAVADGIADTERLRAHVLARHPQIRRTWILGFSMGGAVALASLEQHPAHYAGGVSLCGANLPGDALARELLTTLVAFDHFFPKAAGFPADGLVSKAAGALDQGGLHAGIDAALRTRPDIARLLAARLEVEPDGLAGIISLHALVFHDLVDRYGGLPVGNHDTVYAGFGDDVAFNAGVARHRADPRAHAAIVAQLPLTGALKRPAVIQYNHNDPTIPPRMQMEYAQMATRAGASSLLEVLPAVGEGHCGFAHAQTVEALKAVTD